MLLRILVASILWPTLSTNAFYLPGAAPHDYKLNETVAVFVNALTPKLLYGDSDKLVSLSAPLMSSWSYPLPQEINDQLFGLLTRKQMSRANCTFRRLLQPQIPILST